MHGAALTKAKVEAITSRTTMKHEGNYGTIPKVHPAIQSTWESGSNVFEATVSNLLQLWGIWIV